MAELLALLDDQAIAHAAFIGTSMGGLIMMTLAALRPVRDVAHRFGGSHAQRDVIDLTLVEAARRAGDHGLVAALEADRAAARLRVID